jgi:hypothetical protein
MASIKTNRLSQIPQNEPIFLPRNFEKNTHEYSCHPGVPLGVGPPAPNVFFKDPELAG